MARRTRTQRAGKGSHTFKATIHAKQKAKYASVKNVEKNGTVKAEVMGLKTDPSKTSVLAEIGFGKKSIYIIAAEGIFVGQEIEFGSESSLNIGNVLPLASLPEGTPVFNVEKSPGDGGKFIRASGKFGLIVTKDKKAVYVKMPSGKNKPFNPDSRATIGLAAGGGRTEKPLVKAGAKFHLMKAKGKKYPRTRGVAMNPVDHPFGGSQHHAGKSKSTKRGSPPGRAVGAIASKRTGRRKK
jgi:large subunit ribosomal protein L2